MILETLSENLETCNDLLIDNRLSLHLGKTEAMIFGTKYKIKKTERFAVKCKNTTINYYRGEMSGNQDRRNS